MNSVIGKLTADKKKLSVMVSLLAVMLLLWGRLLLKQVPRTAVAEPAQAVVSEQEAATPTVTGLWPSVVLHGRLDLHRDLFRFHKDRYPGFEAASHEVQPEKSRTDLPDDNARIEAVREWANTLVLQAAIVGEHPRAMINSQVYRLGDKINGFTIRRVEARLVVLEDQGIEIHLPLGD